MKETDFLLRTRITGRFDPEPPTQAEVDIMKEKAEALGRAGARLEENLQRIKNLEQRLDMLEREGRGEREVNALIREFNQARQMALQYLHYLIIQREALGFRRHANIMGYISDPFQKEFF